MLKNSFSYPAREKKARSSLFRPLHGLLLLASMWMVCFFFHHKVLSYGSSTYLLKKITPPGTSTLAAQPPISNVAGVGDGDKNFVDKNDVDSLYVIFSTDCSQFQDWQSLLLMHSAAAVGQVGTLTRIASGCGEIKQRELIALYRTLHPSFAHVHFTPDFSLDTVTGKRYEFYNKPRGVLHWLQHARPAAPPGAIVALIDPDFVFLRPLTAHLKRHGGNVLLSHGVKAAQMTASARKGHPVAQNYGLGAPWASDRSRELNRSLICDRDSPCMQVPNERIGGRLYSVGPPYMLERDDLHRLAVSWVHMVPKVYRGYPDLLAEMFAFSMAAAHQQLPHLRVDHFMVSNIDIDEEGWPWVDALGDDVAAAPKNGIYFPGQPLPTFVHYCQFYRAARIGFHKRRVPGDLFSCSEGLFVELPSGLARVDHKEREGGEVIAQTRKQALHHYKTKLCGDQKFNLNKTINLAGL